jgi:[acyl-carrier-protein] S-malonyltransferase
MVLARVRPAALAIAVHDVLVESGIHPQAIGGMSLGGMAAACIAGALDREALFRLLVHLGQAPEAPAGSPPQAAALVYVPRLGEDTSAYYATDHEDVYFACDIGPTIDGSIQVIMLTGYREALEKLAAELPPGAVFMTQHTEAFHSPIQQYVADHMAPFIAETEFRDPRIPVYSPFAPGVLATGDQIRDLFLRNSTHPVSLPVIHGEMARRGTKLAIVPGASLPPGALKFPFSVAHIESPQDVSDAMMTMYELGVRPSTQGHGKQ